MNDFEELHRWLHEKLRAEPLSNHKLLGYGTKHPDEYHWRLRTPRGEIIIITVEKEP